MIMRTFEQRLEFMQSLLSDKDINLSPKEAYTYTYHWLCYEWFLRKEKKAHQKRRKHAIWLQNQKEIYVLRKEMTDL